MKLEKWMKSVRICAVLLWLECIIVTYLPDETLEPRKRAAAQRSVRPPGSAEEPRAAAPGTTTPDPAIAASIGAEGMALLAKMVCPQGADVGLRGSGGLSADSGQSTEPAVGEQPPSAAPAPAPAPAPAKSRARRHERY